MTPPSKDSPESLPVIRIALAGQPNVGKSVIFNQLTGLSQVIGNWPGKTVAKAEGSARFGGYTFKIIDLPGIYSLSTYSLEEVVSRDYILNEKPDYIINVVDASQLERNLFLTLQLAMLNRPMILSLNQCDLLQERGYKMDLDNLRGHIGIPIIPAVAVHNRGVHELLETIIQIEEKKSPSDMSTKDIVNSKFYNNGENDDNYGTYQNFPKSLISPKFGKEIETSLDNIQDKFPKQLKYGNYPKKFLAIKLLEDDEESIRMLRELNPQEKSWIDRALYLIGESRQNLEDLHGEQISTIINAEIYNISTQIIGDVLKLHQMSRKKRWSHYLDHLTLDNFTGYIFTTITNLQLPQV